MTQEDEEFNRIEREAAMRKEAVRATMAKPRIDQSPDYERGFIDGMQHQMKSSVDKAVNAMSTPPECQTDAEKTAFAFGWWKALEINRAPQRPWVGLTLKDIKIIENNAPTKQWAILMTEAALKDKNK